MVVYTCNPSSQEVRGQPSYIVNSRSGGGRGKFQRHMQTYRVREQADYPFIWLPEFMILSVVIYYHIVGNPKTISILLCCYVPASQEFECGFAGGSGSEHLMSVVKPSGRTADIGKFYGVERYAVPRM